MEKTIVTYCGDQKLFESVQNLIETELPQEMIEWKRNYGRASKNVVIHPKFIKFDQEEVSKSCSVKTLLGQSIFHTYWTECSDMDTYKNSTKDEIMNWITNLKKCGAPHDWMVVLVETPESRRTTNKLLPRSSVVDKLRTDLGSKYSDRCLTLLDPLKIKMESRACESWQTLLHRLRLLLLQAYNRTMMKFEENMRSQREKRNDPKWNFCDYFLLQEELAFVYEMLGVFDESLVQYDELDALFTQFVLNSNITKSPGWLDAFCGNFTDWTGLSLQPEENLNLRKRILGKEPSLLDVRNYMFARQSLLLLQMNKPWEVGRRCLSFLHNGVQELSILDIHCPSGSVACWVLLSALEVLKTFQEFSTRNSTANQVQQYCFYTAELWSYCREKMLHLGELCGLLPGCSPSSQQLHFVVELSSGIREVDAKADSPVNRLKEALSSKSAFEKYYLELAESAISTYKHIGRIRSARMVGLELAKFYLEMGQIQKANGFLVDALKTFENEGWSLLKIQTLTDTAKCYETLKDSEKLVRTCAQIACAKELVTSDQKLIYFEKLMDTAKNNLDELTPVDAEDLLTVKNVKMSTQGELDKVTPGSEIQLHLEIESHFPGVLNLDSIAASLNFSEPPSQIQVPQEDNKRKRKPANSRPQHLKSVQRTPSNRSTTSTASSLISLDPILDEDASTDVTEDQFGNEEENRLEFIEQFDYKQDKSLAAVRLVCRNATKVLKRKDSSGSILKDGSVKRSDFTHCFTLSGDASTSLELRPGQNEFILKTSASLNTVGNFTLNQLSLLAFGKVDLLSEKWPKKLRYCVITEPHSFSITSQNLWAGFPQEIKLNIFTGSHHLQEGAKVSLRGSLGLKIGQNSEDLASSVCLSVPQANPFQTVTVQLYVKSELMQTKDGSMIEQRLMIEDPWQEGKETLLPLYFRPPFTTTAKMQTALTKKFLQFSLQANYDEPTFQAGNPTVQSQTNFRLINPKDEILTLKRGIASSFIWEIVAVKDQQIPDELKATVEISYGKMHQNFEQQPFSFNVDFKDFKTQYLLKYRIDPAKGGELCRASSICSLSITVEQISKSSHTSLMYEVLADQSVWAICGRAAGVIDMETAEKQTFIVEVMPLCGGHLALPKVRLSKYILPNNPEQVPNLPSSDPDCSSNMPRLEPFSSGQVYNLTRTARIHVLPSPNAIGQQSNLISINEAKTVSLPPLFSSS